MGREEADRVSGLARNFGTKVHSYVAKVLRGETRKIPADIFPHVAAVKEFGDSHFSEIYEIELQQANKAEGFGGTLDLYGLDVYRGDSSSGLENL